MQSNLKFMRKVYTTYSRETKALKYSIHLGWCFCCYL